MPEPLVGTLDEQKLQKLAKENLNEDPDRLQEDLQALKEWIKKQPHLNEHIPSGKKSSFIQALNR